MYHSLSEWIGGLSQGVLSGHTGLLSACQAIPEEMPPDRPPPPRLASALPLLPLRLRPLGNASPSSRVRAVGTAMGGGGIPDGGVRGAGDLWSGGGPRIPTRLLERRGGTGRGGSICGRTAAGLGNELREISWRSGGGGGYSEQRTAGASGCHDATIAQCMVLMGGWIGAKIRSAVWMHRTGLGIPRRRNTANPSPELLACMVVRTVSDQFRCCGNQWLGSGVSKSMENSPNDGREEA